MTKITNRNLTDRFIELFEDHDKPFTPSEKRMNGIKLAQLRKNVSSYLEENKIETDLSVNEIIMDCMEYSSVIGMKFKSMASLGFDVLPESIEYWKKRRKVEKVLKERSNQKENNNIDVVIDKSYNKINQKRQPPKWLNDTEW